MMPLKFIPFVLFDAYEQAIPPNLSALFEALQDSAISNEKELIANLKTQLEKHNNIVFSDQEFAKVLNTLSKGKSFEKAKTLRQRQLIVLDNGENFYFEFINQDFWCQNEFQVARQITMEGK